MQQPVFADAGQEDVDLSVGIEVGCGNAHAGPILGQTESGGGIFETAVTFVQEQGIANRSIRPDDSRCQEEVEPAVSVGVERRDGRSETSANPANHGQSSP